VNYSFKSRDVIVDLHPKHAPWTVGVLFFEQYNEYGNPTWYDFVNDMNQGHWAFPIDLPLRNALDDSGLIRDTDFEWSKKQETWLVYKNGGFHKIDHVPVFFFKDRQTFMRLKLYL
jgi:hypothetical protein